MIRFNKLNRNQYTKNIFYIKSNLLIDSSECKNEHDRRAVEYFQNTPSQIWSRWHDNDFHYRDYVYGIPYYPMLPLYNYTNHKSGEKLNGCYFCLDGRGKQYIQINNCNTWTSYKTLLLFEIIHNLAQGNSIRFSLLNMLTPNSWKNAFEEFYKAYRSIRKLNPTWTLGCVTTRWTSLAVCLAAVAHCDKLPPLYNSRYAGARRLA